MNKDKLRDECFEKALNVIMNESEPGESNLVALLTINLRLLIKKVYDQGWDDGWDAREV